MYRPTGFIDAQKFFHRLIAKTPKRLCSDADSDHVYFDIDCTPLDPEETAYIKTEFLDKWLEKDRADRGLPAAGELVEGNILRYTFLRDTDRNREEVMLFMDELHSRCLESGTPLLPTPGHYLAACKQGGLSFDFTPYDVSGVSNELLGFDRVRQRPAAILQKRRDCVAAKMEFHDIIARATKRLHSEALPGHTDESPAVRVYFDIDCSGLSKAEAEHAKTQFMDKWLDRDRSNHGLPPTGEWLNDHTLRYTFVGKDRSRGNDALMFFLEMHSHCLLPDGALSRDDSLPPDESLLPETTDYMRVVRSPGESLTFAPYEIPRANDVQADGVTSHRPRRTAEAAGIAGAA